MKTTVYKETEIDISPKEVVRNIIDDLESDKYAIMDMVQGYLIEELSDFVFSVTETYHPTDEELDEITELALPKLKELYNNQINEFKKLELEQLSNKQNILDWIDSMIYYSSEEEPGYWLSPEEILNAILENGTKSRF